MATPSEDQPKKELDQGSDTDHTTHPPATATSSSSCAGQARHPPSPPLNYPHYAISYAPVIGLPHPQAQHGYAPPPPPPPNNHGYPPNASNPYSYTQTASPLPPTYYDTTQSNATGNTGLIRCCLALLILFILASCLSTFMAWFILHPLVPIFRVEAFHVSNFNTTNPDFASNWEANVTVKNPNRKLTVYLNEIRSFMYYKEDYLASDFVDPLMLQIKEHDVLHVKLSANNLVEHEVGDWVVDDMVRDRNGGSLSFNFRLQVSSSFKSGTWWTREHILKVCCDNLNVQFVGATGNGMLPFGESRRCSVHV
uniref:Late embryogenesis abundant protein LEA-2 subgroup domain-containing protein n=1 Tax=Fagus sylvatica TaxID=28930 RepID=A0A2N9G9R2_FAGSY